jgi:hypothetical protein
MRRTCTAHRQFTGRSRNMGPMIFRAIQHSRGSHLNIYTGYPNEWDAATKQQMRLQMQDLEQYETQQRQTQAPQYKVPRTSTSTSTSTQWGTGSTSTRTHTRTH